MAKSSLDNCEVTIIVPVYNGEKYIESCVKTVVEQGDFGVKLFFINDGSNDSTEKEIQKWKEQYAFISYISILNGGVSNARNVGLKAVTTKYVMFLDCDDELSPNSIKELVYLAENENVQVVSAVVEHRYPKYSEYEYISTASKKMKKNEAITEFLKQKTISMSACGKLFLTESIKNIKFDSEIRINEDKKFVFDVLSQIEHIYCYNKVAYIYHQNSNSTTHARVDCRWLDMLKVSNYISSKIDNGVSELKESSDIDTFITYQHFLRIVTRVKVDFLDKKYTKEIKKILKQTKKNAFLVIDTKKKIEYYLCVYFNWCYPIFLKIFDILKNRRDFRCSK